MSVSLNKIPALPPAPEGHPLIAALATLNADFWINYALSLPDACAMVACEHSNDDACFCAEDCECSMHTAERQMTHA